jgi:predicted nucleic acid-binding protein
MSLVIDSSMTLAWYFEDEKTAASLAVLERVVETGAIVPALWRLEVASGLQVAVRRRRITVAYRDASLSDLRMLPVTVDPQTDDHAWAETLALSDRYGLTPYDAAYLELARRRQLPLATLDEALIRVAPSEQVTLVGTA